MSNPKIEPIKSFLIPSSSKKTLTSRYHYFYLIIQRTPTTGIFFQTLILAVQVPFEMYQDAVDRAARITSACSVCGHQRSRGERYRLCQGLSRVFLAFCCSKTQNSPFLCRRRQKRCDHCVLLRRAYTAFSLPLSTMNM